MSDTTTRWGIIEPSADRSDPADVPLFVRNVTQALEARGVMYGQGLAGARPISTPGTPGLIGRIYYATDTGLLYYDYGTGWATVSSAYSGPGAGTITNSMLADDSVDERVLAPNSVGSTEIIDGAVSAAEIANALKPSAGAGGSVEALRALGTAAGQAAAGTHAGQHSRTGADPLAINSFIGIGVLSARPSTGLVPGQIYTATDVAGGTTYMWDGAAWQPMAAAVSPSAVVASTVAGLGATFDGKIGMIVTGTDVIHLRYSSTIGKWVSPAWYVGQGGGGAGGMNWAKVSPDGVHRIDWLLNAGLNLQARTIIEGVDTQNDQNSCWGRLVRYQNTAPILATGPNAAVISQTNFGGMNYLSRQGGIIDWVTIPLTAGQVYAMVEAQASTQDSNGHTGNFSGSLWMRYTS